MYRILGTDITNFTVSLFDSTVILNAPDSLVTLNNQIWCESNQGVVAVSDSGSVIQSRPIEHDLIMLSSSLYPHFASSTFGIGYESDRHYNLCSNTATTDTNATQEWVYNFLTQTWNRWNLGITAGIVSLTPDDHLYVCYSNGQVARERKNWVISDFADFEYNISITSFSGFTVHVTSSANIAVGDTIWQSVGQSIVTVINSATQITVEDSNITWNIGTAIDYKPIALNMTWTPIGGNFAWVKHFQDFQAFFRDATFTDLKFGFASDFDTTTEYTTISSFGGGGFGTVPFGNEPFGGGRSVAQVPRTLVPRNKARCHWLTPSITHSEALSNFTLMGINFYYLYTSSRTR